MKRRKILGAMGILGIPGIGSAASSIYGTPVSVTGPVSTNNTPLRILLENIDVPSQLIPAMAQFGTMWERVLGDENEQRRFRNDPAGYLRTHEIPGSVLDSRDQEVRLLMAMTNEDVLRLAISSDYAEFLRKLKELGITGDSSKSELKKKVLSILRENKREISIEVTRQSRAQISSAKIGNIPTSDIVRLYGLLAPSIEQVAMAAVPVAIAAIAVVYVSVAAVVNITVLGAIMVSVAMVTAITISAEQCTQIGNDTLFAGPGAVPSLSRSERQRQTEHAIAQRELIGKRMLVLSPERLGEAQEVARLSRLLNNGDFVLESNRQLVRDEVSVFLDAAMEVGLLRIEDNMKDEVVKTLQNVALRAAALA